MSNVIDLPTRKHIYELDYCAGCGDLITGVYTELGLPSGDGQQLKHIALCSECSSVSKKEGVI